MTILDDRTLAIPDRPGNNRADSLRNLLENPAIGLLFVVPGLTETLRVNGTATLTTDPELLDRMLVRDRRPVLAIVVDVAEAFLHCGKAMIRSRLWDPDRHVDPASVPSVARMLIEQLGMDDDLVDGAEAAVADDYENRLY